MGPSRELLWTFTLIREQCRWIEECFATYDALFGSEGKNFEIMKRAAPVFFIHLNRILYENYILQACKITDPAASMAKDGVDASGKARYQKRSNLTISHLNELLVSEGFVSVSIDNLTNMLHSYRKRIEKARNMQVSHLDKETAMAFLNHGLHRKGEALEFVANLRDYQRAVSTSIGVGTISFPESAAADASRLLEMLNDRK